MLTAIIALSYQIAQGNIVKELIGTTPGGYYEITHVQCDPITKKTYSVGVRYEVDWNGSGDKHILHTQPRVVDGCQTKEFIANTIVADNYIKVLK